MESSGRHLVRQLLEIAILDRASCWGYRGISGGVHFRFCKPEIPPYSPVQMFVIQVHRAGPSPPTRHGYHPRARTRCPCPPQGAAR